MRWARSAQLAAMISCSAACDDSTCETRSCPTVDQNAAGGDLRFEVSPQSLAVLEVEKFSASVPIQGEIIAGIDDLSCVPQSGRTCRAVVKRLRLRIEAVIDTNRGTFDVETTAAMETPIGVDNAGTGFQIPASTNVHSCSTVDGRSDHGEAELGEPSFLDFDTTAQSADFDGVLPLVAHLPSTDACTKVPMTVTVAVTAARVP